MTPKRQSSRSGGGGQVAQLEGLEAGVETGGVRAEERREGGPRGTEGHVFTGGQTWQRG